MTFFQNLPRPRRCRDDFFQNLPQPHRHRHSGRGAAAVAAAAAPPWTSLTDNHEKLGLIFDYVNEYFEKGFNPGENAVRNKSFTV
jgi:hypothetical protein